MRLSTLFLVIPAILLGLAAAFMTVNWLDAQRGRPVSVAAAAPSDPVTHIVVASQPLRFGTELTPVNVKEIAWPGKSLPQGAFGSISDLVKSGQRRVALGPIEINEPVLSHKVTGPGQRSSLSAVIDNDKIAVTIRVNDVSGAAGFVLPGDRVNVLLTRTEDKEGFTDVLLQNVRVLGIDQIADERAEKPAVVKAVTLEVSALEGQKLALGETMGRLSLALRPAGATAEEGTRRVTLADLGTPKPRPVVIEKIVERQPEKVVAPPPPQPKITIWHGVTRRDYTREN